MAVTVLEPPHFRLLAQVRWQVFRNSMKKGFKRVEVLVRGVTWIGGIATVCLISLGMAFGGYVAFLKRPNFLTVVLWILFLAWQILPVVMEGSVPALDFRELARYPIRFRLFAAMSLAYGVLDPIALSCITFLIALAVGCIFAQPWYVGPIVVFFGLFALFNLLLNRIIQRWIERITATRKGRDLLLGSIIAISIFFQFFFWFIVPAIEKDARRSNRPKIMISTTNRWSPATLASLGAQQPAAEGLRSLAALAGASAVLSALFYRQVRAMYLGELDAEGVRRSGAIQVQPGWQLPFAGSQLSAMVEKEIRQALGVGRIWINQLSAWSMVLVAALSPDFLTRAFNWKSTSRVESLLPFAVGYSMIVLSSLAFNIFWSDAGGIYRWLLSPIDMRRLVIAKNLFFALSALGNLFIITVLIRIGTPITFMQWTNTFLAVIWMTLGLAAVGNILSVWFPKKVEASKFNTKNASDAATLLGFVTFGALIAGWMAANWVGRHWQDPLLALAALAALILVGVGGYLLSLTLSARYLEKNTEKICDELA